MNVKYHVSLNWFKILSLKLRNFIIKTVCMFSCITMTRFMHCPFHTVMRSSVVCSLNIIAEIVIFIQLLRVAFLSYSFYQNHLLVHNVYESMIEMYKVYTHSLVLNSFEVTKMTDFVVLDIALQPTVTGKTIKAKRMLKQ